ncbi:transmembrane protein 80-like isoform X3 [Perca fluviatilis]|uniref:transmembrane protein 80-like isoform X3 n=1 Tax=Perca fluviatilis TaxID=8168 RepID=UPI0019644451|nr:transmembrane protein 80-like isoform X3 [Perca fluviatilis]
MAMHGPGRSANVSALSSVTFQLLLKLTAVYFVFYFLFTLGLIIRKSVKGNLTESERYILANLIVTGTTILLTIYFLVWQTYVMRADVIISSVLLVAYGLDGVLALSTLARLARSVPLSLVFITDSIY